MSEEKDEKAAATASAVDAMKGVLEKATADAAVKETKAAEQPAQDATPEAKEEAKTTPETPETTWTPRELNAAKKFGLDEAALTALGAEAPKVLARLVKADSSIGERYARIGKTERDLRQRAEAKPAKAEPEEEAPIEVPGDAELEKLFDPEVFGEQPAKLLTRLVKDSVRRDKEAQEAQVREAERFKAEVAEKAHDIIKGLDAEIYSELGGGESSKELLDGGPEITAREAVIEDAINRMLGRWTAAGEAMEMDDAIQESLMAKYPESYAKAWAKRNVKTGGDKRDLVSSRASGAQHAPASDPRKEAIAAMQDVAAKHGYGLPV